MHRVGRAGYLGVNISTRFIEHAGWSVSAAGGLTAWWGLRRVDPAILRPVVAA
jgi:hypothetical protein